MGQVRPGTALILLMCALLVLDLLDFILHSRYSRLVWSWIITIYFTVCKEMCCYVITKEAQPKTFNFRMFCTFYETWNRTSSFEKFIVFYFSLLRQQTGSSLVKRHLLPSFNTTSIMIITYYHYCLIFYQFKMLVGWYHVFNSEYIFFIFSLMIQSM